TSPSRYSRGVASTTGSAGGSVAGGAAQAMAARGSRQARTRRRGVLDDMGDLRGRGLQHAMALAGDRPGPRWSVGSQRVAVATHSEVPMRASFSAALLAAVLSLPIVSAAAAAAPPQADAAASEDQSRATPRGTTFLLPGGWTLATEGNATIIGPPEADG